MSEEVKEVLQQVRNLESEGKIETSIGDILFTATASNLDKEDLLGVIKAVHSHPSWFRDFELRCDDPTIRLFGKSATGVVTHTDGFEELAELDLSSDPDRAEDGFNRYRDQDFDEATGFIHSLVTKLHSSDGKSVTLKGILDKPTIEAELVSTFPSVLQNEMNVCLWPTPSALDRWVNEHQIKDVVDAFFRFDKLPIFVFETPVSSVIESSIVIALEDIEELEGVDLADSQDHYEEAMQRARKGTTWHGDLSPVPPAAIIPVRETISSFRSVLVYSIFGVFSSAVESKNGLVKFTITSEPKTFEKQVDLHEVSRQFDSSDVNALVSAYGNYEEHEDKAPFRNFWRLAIANTCDDLVNLPDQIDGVRTYYEDLLVDAVEENFDDLSDAVQQIHSFMTGLTNRVSDAATELSRQIQTLLFTLIGTIVANLFLVLRWNNVTFVPPFSLFIVAVLIGFYFPLIQDRIEDLSKLRKQVEEDYEMYEGEIRRFSEEIFNFEELAGRKNSYINLAKKKEQWAQDRLELTFRLLIVTWTFLAIWSFIGYAVVSMQVAVGVASLVGLVGIYRYHSGNEYFDNRYVGACVIIGGGILVLRILFEVAPSGLW